MTGKTQHLICGLVLTGLVASGCQTSAPAKPAGLDNTGFMSLWDTYSHCRVSSDLSEAYRDMRALSQASLVRNRPDGFVLPLPTKLQQLVNSPTNRLAVDVNAMASACSLHAGQLALEQGRVDLARELFDAVLALHPSEESSYYLVQAKTLLRGMERGVEVSARTP